MKIINRTAVFLASAVLAGAVIGCGPERRDEPVTEPLDLNDPQVVLGQKVFSRHCYQCHPGGASGLGPAINDKPLPVFGIKTQVRVGAGHMPAFSDKEISDEELEGVVKYLKGLRGLRGTRV